MQFKTYVLFILKYSFTDSNVSYVTWFVGIFIAVFVICCVALYFDISVAKRLPVLKNIVKILLRIRRVLSIRREFEQWLESRSDSRPSCQNRIEFRRELQSRNPRLGHDPRLERFLIRPLTNWNIFRLVIKLVFHLLVLCFVISLICTGFYYGYRQYL